MKTKLRVAPYVTWAIEVFVIGVAIALLLIALDSDEPGQEKAPPAAADTTVGSLRSAADASTGQFEIDIDGARGDAAKSPAEDLIAMTIEGGTGMFDRRTSGFYLELPLGLAVGIARVARHDGVVEVSQDPDGEIGSLGPDSFSILLDSTAALIDSGDSESDEKGVVATVAMPARTSRVLIDLVRVSPDGRRMLEGFAAPKELPVQVETYSTSDRLTQVIYRYKQDDDSALSFSVTIRPKELDGPVRVKELGPSQYQQ